MRDGHFSSYSSSARASSIAARAASLSRMATPSPTWRRQSSNGGPRGQANRRVALDHVRRAAATMNSCTGIAHFPPVVTQERAASLLPLHKRGTLPWWVSSLPRSGGCESGGHDRKRGTAGQRAPRPAYARAGPGDPVPAGRDLPQPNYATPLLKELNLPVQAAERAERARLRLPLSEL